METLLHKAILAALAAGQEILEVYDTNFKVIYKEDDTPVTLADQSASDRIEQMLAVTDIPVLSEEGEQTDYERRQHWDRLWIVDPLDGTKEFVKRNGEFTVNIALVEKGQPVLGVIYAPVFKDIYFGMKGLGAFKLDRHEVMAIFEELPGMSLEQILQLAKKLPLRQTRNRYTIVASRSHLSGGTFQRLKELQARYKEVDVVNTGSSIKMCWVAEGLADEYPRYGPTMEWDTAAGQAILEQAGAELIDHVTQQPMRYNRERLLNNSFTAKRKDVDGIG